MAKTDRSEVDSFDHLYDTKYFDEPKFLSAEVVHGFKRGSKELGVPTANLSMEDLGCKGSDLPTGKTFRIDKYLRSYLKRFQLFDCLGIYFGWCLLKQEVHKTVVSVGWNPFYQNTTKTVEAHLLSSLEDFYGERIDVVLCGYLRNEANFKSLGKPTQFTSFSLKYDMFPSVADELTSCIRRDIELSVEMLAEQPAARYHEISSWPDESKVVK